MPRYLVPPDVTFAAIGLEAVLVNAGSGVYFGLDTVGTRMWHAVAQFGELERAYQELLGSFDVAPDRLRDDLSRFVQELVAHRLLIEER